MEIEGHNKNLNESKNSKIEIGNNSNNRKNI
jgi:hypothetical protein